MNTRIEHDSIGDKAVPAEVYYGVQSLRAAENFPVTGHRLEKEFINALAEIKKACAIVNMRKGLLEKDKGDAIVRACNEILSGLLHDQFIVDPVQGGAGTSMNMNANEVIANRAGEMLGGALGKYDKVHPNDHVNMGQSTNDVIPSAGKVTAIRLLRRSVAELERLYAALMMKADEFDDVLKMGRTQMQDAVPIRLGQEFRAYAGAMKRDIVRLRAAEGDLRVLNLGGTAIGTCVNADPEFVKEVVPELALVTGLPVVQADDLIDATQNLDEFVATSSAVRTCAVNLSKMANDLRLMSSGPRCGFGEINLPARQNGSSIMPGKVNPVIPEVINQVAFDIIGNDVTISIAAEAGQLELNAFEPVIFCNLFHSLSNLAGAVKTFIDHCIIGITANREHCLDQVEHSVGIITPLCRYVGYQKAADIAKQAIRTGASVRELIISQGILTPEETDRVLDAYAMTEPKRG